MTDDASPDEPAEELPQHLLASARKSLVQSPPDRREAIIRSHQERRLLDAGLERLKAAADGGTLTSDLDASFSNSPTIRETMRQLIGARIKARRMELRMTQQELAGKTGQGRFTISHYEAGRAGVDSGDIPLFCVALRVPVSFFYEEIAIAVGMRPEIEDYYMALPEDDRDTVLSLLKILYAKRHFAVEGSAAPAPVRKIHSRNRKGVSKANAK